MPYPQFFSAIMLVALLSCQLSFSADDSRINLSYSFDHISYAGPMAVLQLANDWHGDLKSGRDAVSFLENKVEAKSGNFQISILSRTYHEFLIGNDLARGFYYYNNGIELDQELRIDAALQAKSYSGDGIQLGYDFNVLSDKNYSLSITPKLTALRLTDIIWGHFEGELFYSDTKNWGGTIDLDYHYTKDHVVRRPLRGEYIGQLYGFDLDVLWQSKYVDIFYQGTNVASRIYWDGIPTTTAQISTETAFLLFGYEYYEDVVLTAPALHYSRITMPLPNAIFKQGLSLRTDSYFSAIREFHFHGIEWATSIDWFSEVEEISFSAQYDFSSKSRKFSVVTPNLSTTLASQTFDLSKSQQLIVNLTFSYTF